MRHLVLGIALAACTDGTGDPGSDPPPVQEEIDGIMVDPVHGRCTGVVGDRGWARCLGTCEPLDEGVCGVTAGCRIAYSDDLRTGAEEHVFRACLPVGPGTVPAGACDALSAEDCSRRDDCTALHGGLFHYAPFVRCEPQS